ncbi:MAG: peptide deformylase [Patescibacteria group bacterium]
MSTDFVARLKALERVLMEVPELTYAGNLVLRTPAAEVTVDEGKDIASRLEDALLKYRAITGTGRGLAAPQIGVGKAVFITYLEDKIEVFLNPRIVGKSGETSMYKELCMSVGVVAADVERPQWIVLAWTDLEGNAHEEKFDSFKARLYQHEEAHLRGLLNIDEAVSGGIELANFDPLKEQLRPK